MSIRGWDLVFGVILGMSLFRGSRLVVLNLGGHFLWGIEAGALVIEAAIKAIILKRTPKTAHYVITTLKPL